MFDSFGWPWEYEPYDLDGYIPDFALIFKTGIVLAEIKADLQLRGLRKYQAKMDHSGWEDRSLILGGTPFLDGHRPEDPGDIVTLGWYKLDGTWLLGELIFCETCHRVSVSTEDNISCMVSGCKMVSTGFPSRLEAMWGKAHNLTKWTG